MAFLCRIPISELRIGDLNDGSFLECAELPGDNGEPVRPCDFELLQTQLNIALAGMLSQRRLNAPHDLGYGDLQTAIECCAALRGKPISKEERSAQAVCSWLSGEHYCCTRHYQIVESLFADEHVTRAIISLSKLLVDREMLTGGEVWTCLSNELQRSV